MSSMFLRKLGRFLRLPAGEAGLVRRLAAERARLLGARQDISSEGERSTSVKILESGWACRSRVLADGRRQIVALLLPGDLCDFDGLAPTPLDHSITTLTPVSLREIPHEAFGRLLRSHPALMAACLRDNMLAAAIQREWTVSLGQRNARERMAHLLCEIMLRLELVGLSDGQSCEFPLTQVDLGDATGLSTVHVNRTLQELRSEGLVTLRERRLHVSDTARLAEIGLFERSYLQPSLPEAPAASARTSGGPAAGMAGGVFGPWS